MQLRKFLFTQSICQHTHRNLDHVPYSIILSIISIYELNQNGTGSFQQCHSGWVKGLETRDRSTRVTNTVNKQKNMKINHFQGHTVNYHCLLCMKDFNEWTAKIQNCVISRGHSGSNHHCTLSLFSGNSLAHGRRGQGTSTKPETKIVPTTSPASPTLEEVNTPTLSRALADDDIPYQLLTAEEIGKCQALAEQYFAPQYAAFDNYSEPLENIVTGSVTQ